MANDEAPREERRRMTTPQWTGEERRSRFATGAGGQLLERGEGVADPVGSLGDDRDVFSGEGETGTGGEGGFSTLAGGIVNGQGSTDDAPNYGDWNRHSTGTTSGAVGHEGFDFEGEGTWGENERDRERKEESGGDQERRAAMSGTDPKAEPAPGPPTPPADSAEGAAQQPGAGELDMPNDQGDGADDRHTDRDGPNDAANHGGGV